MSATTEFYDDTEGGRRIAYQQGRPVCEWSREQINAIRAEQLKIGNPLIKPSCEPFGYYRRKPEQKA